MNNIQCYKKGKQEKGIPSIHLVVWSWECWSLSQWPQGTSQGTPWIWGANLSQSKAHMLTHPIIHSRQFGITNQPTRHVFGLWKKSREAGWNPAFMQTPNKHGTETRFEGVIVRDCMHHQSMIKFTDHELMTKTTELLVCSVYPQCHPVIQWHALTCRLSSTRECKRRILVLISKEWVCWTSLLRLVKSTTQFSARFHLFSQFV